MSNTKLVDIMKTTNAVEAILSRVGTVYHIKQEMNGTALLEAYSKELDELHEEHTYRITTDSICSAIEELNNINVTKVIVEFYQADFSSEE